mmetsp:Transcript_7468/g.28281  ORF Transcript_7468/g.28281 Transcript_7468/m.28281 type:complete len:202 (-) Transcript_7468:171-776(-)
MASSSFSSLSAFSTRTMTAADWYSSSTAVTVAGSSSACAALAAMPSLAPSFSVGSKASRQALSSSSVASRAWSVSCSALSWAFILARASNFGYTCSLGTESLPLTNISSDVSSAMYFSRSASTFCAETLTSSCRACKKHRYCRRWISSSFQRAIILAGTSPRPSSAETMDSWYSRHRSLNSSTSPSITGSASVATLAASSS